MWLLLGLTSVITAVLNLLAWSKGKQTEYYRFISLSLTALTVCAFYSDGAKRVISKDWGGLLDIMPTMSTTLCVCVIASIMINGISLFGALLHGATTHRQ